VPCFSNTANAVSCLERTIRITFFSPLAAVLLVSVALALGDVDAVLESLEVEAVGVEPQPIKVVDKTRL